MNPEDQIEIGAFLFHTHVDSWLLEETHVKKSMQIPHRDNLLCNIFKPLLWCVLSRVFFSLFQGCPTMQRLAAINGLVALVGSESYLVQVRKPQSFFTYLAYIFICLLPLMVEHVAGAFRSKM